MKALSARLMQTLEATYGGLWATIWPEEYSFEDPFKQLVITILSQNTSNANAIRAYQGLAARFPVTPQGIVSAAVDQLREAIRSGGLYNIKARRLKDVAQMILDQFEGDAASLLAGSRAEAKQRLLRLPGIGEKTADVLLTGKYSYRKVLPIDTHFDRLAKRLGIATPAAGYAEVQAAYMGFMPEAYRERAAGLLWLLAKRTCRARAPRCAECPIAGICDYATRVHAGTGKHEVVH